MTESKLEKITEKVKKTKTINEQYSNSEIDLLKYIHSPSEDKKTINNYGNSF